MIKHIQLDTLDIIKTAIFDKAPSISALFKVAVAVMVSPFVLVFSCIVGNLIIDKRYRVVLSEKDLNKFKDFIKRENIDVGREEHCYARSFKGSKIISVNVFEAYTKYLIKTSKDHPLKDVPANEIILFYKSENKLSEKCILDLAYRSKKGIPGLSNEAVRRGKMQDYFLLARITRNELKEDVSCLNKADVINTIREDAYDKLGEETDILEISFRKFTNMFNDLESKIPGIKVAKYSVDNYFFVAIPSDKYAEYKKLKQKEEQEKETE